MIEPGARADLLLVEGDATTEIGASTAISRVWLGGRALDADAYPGSELEEAGIEWLRESAAKILRAIEQTWPQWAGGSAGMGT